MQYGPLDFLRDAGSTFAIVGIGTIIIDYILLIRDMRRIRKLEKEHRHKNEVLNVLNNHQWYSYIYCNTKKTVHRILFGFEIYLISHTRIRRNQKSPASWEMKHLERKRGMRYGRHQCYTSELMNECDWKTTSSWFKGLDLLLLIAFIWK